MKYSLTIAIFVSLVVFATTAAVAQTAAKQTPDPSKTAQTAAKPTPDASKAPQTVAKPTPDPSKAPQTIAKPTPDPSKTPAIVAKPAQIVTKPTPEPLKPAQIAVKPSPEPSKPAQIAVKPTPEPSKTGQVVSTPKLDPSNALLQQTLLLQRFAVEMTKLKLEVTELKIELQRTKVTGLENDLRQVQTGKRNLENRRGEVFPDTTQPSRQASFFSVRAESPMKTAWAEKSQERSNSEEQHLQLARREIELSRQLQQERAHLQELKEQFIKLKLLCDEITANGN